MIRSWMCSSLLCIVILAQFVHPSAARLSESKFVPLSKAASYSKEQVKMHQIKKGDTLYRIARQNDVNLESLMEVNGMGEDTILEIGSTVVVPTQGLGAIHVVAPGETMTSIARCYEKNIVDIMAANQGKSPLGLEVGDYVMIPVEARLPDDWDKGIQSSRGAQANSRLAWPVTGIISSYYGGRKSGFHHGVDIANRIGTPIRAADSGTVSFAGSKSVYGRTVIIDHHDGKQTLYAHAQSIIVAKGDKVVRGETIAYVGVTGVTTGPHLHFEVRINRKTCDPLKYLN